MRTRAPILLARLNYCLFAVLVQPALAAPILAQEPLPPGNVVEIDIRGLQFVSGEIARAVLRTRVGQPVTRERLSEDVAALEQLGFFEEVLPPQVEPTPAGPRVILRVREYPRVLVVDFTGNTVFTGDELRQRVPVQAGQVFNVRALDEAVTAIERAYRQRGFVAAVTGDGLPHLRETGVLRLTIEELRVADVRIEGLRRTDESVVRRQLRQRPDQLFNERTLAGDAGRLRQLGLFTQVEPRAEVVSPGRAALTWRVEERKPRDIRAGFSYSSQDRAVGELEYSDVNFRGRAERLRVVGLVGSIDARAGGIVEYFNPWIADPGVTLLVRGFSEPRYRFSRELARAPGAVDRYFERRLGGQLLSRYPRGSRSDVSLGIRFEDVSIDGLPLGQLTPNRRSADGQVAFLSLGATADRRDNVLDPTRGSFTTGLLEGGLVRPDGVRSDSLAKLSLEHRRYVPLRRAPAGERDRRPVPVLALRLMGATSLGDTPFFEQYFLGGLNNLRGYLENRFWGEHLVVASAELRWPLDSRVSGALFVDAGDAWGSDFQFRSGVRTAFPQHRGFSPRVGYGVGLRFATPVGPARLDLGIGEAVRIHFAVGAGF